MLVVVCYFNLNVFLQDGISPPLQQNAKDKIPELRAEDDTVHRLSRPLESRHPNGREPRSPNTQATTQMFYTPDKQSGQMKVYREAEV